MSLGQVVAERVPQPQVVLRCLDEDAHCPAPGHGWATWRSVVRSTFA